MDGKMRLCDSTSTFTLTLREPANVKLRSEGNLAVTDHYGNV